MIRFDEQQQVFHLQNDQISYLMQVESGGFLTHLYFGKRLSGYRGSRRYPRTDRSFSPNLPGASDRLFSLDTLLMEYPGYGFGDFRQPAFQIRQADGSQTTDFRYLSHTIESGKPSLPGLPATYGSDEEVETLVISLKDELSGLELQLSYALFAGRPVIARSAKFINGGNSNVVLEQAGSLALDFPKRDLELIQLNGTWARERQLTRERIETGSKVLDSKRGSSSHQQNPFVALAAPETTEFSGDVYGMCLVYSGNHQTVVQKDPFDQTRVVMGINPFGFSWQLASQESFQTPEVLLVYSDQGLNGMSAAYHDLINKQLVRGRYKEEPRPTLINNWEATYFDFDKDKLVAILDEAQALGIEMFVLDDGWFGVRSDDRMSLGDWFEFEGKIAGGLKGISEEVHRRGMKFGLWFEPEMISENSDLFRAHPDWAFSVPGRQPALGRDQLVLDFSRQDVRDNIYTQMSAILDNCQIDYIKWDMNRNMTDVYSQLLSSERQGEVAHRYMLGLYDFMEKLTTAYPDILFEGCSGGGGRFDAGFLYYMPQIWTSDNTDAVARLKIQYGTSLCYPISTMGSHVSAIPNHQTGRNTSLAIRGNVAMSGVFGYELDLSALSLEEKAEIAQQVAFYKEHRQLLQFGRFIRLQDPFVQNDVAWMFVAPDQSEALVFYFRVLAEAAYPLVDLKLAGLTPDAVYDVEGQAYTSEELMYAGLYIDPVLSGDYATERFYLKRL